MASFLATDLPVPELEKELYLYSGAPCVTGGIRWYEVGQNASHVFYVGVDGFWMLWVRSSDDQGFSAPRRLAPGESAYIGR